MLWTRLGPERAYVPLFSCGGRAWCTVAGNCRETGVPDRARVTRTTLVRRLGRQLRRVAGPQAPGRGASAMSASAYRLLREEPGGIGEGLEFERVAGRVEDEERRLLPGQALEARAGLDHPFHVLAPEPCGECGPLGEPEHHATVRHRDALAVDRVVVRADAPVRAECRVQMADELVAVEIEVHPVVRTASLGAAQHATVEGARLGDVAHLERDVKGGEGHLRTINRA